MVNEFLYGRLKNGYGRLNDVSEAGYSPEDMTGFQHLWVYDAAEGCDRNRRPQSRSYYVSNTSLGPVAQVGRTTFVPAGTSRESGGRDTSLLHKYLFVGDDFRRLMQTPDRILGITDFCSTVEEAMDRNTADCKLLMEEPGLKEEDVNVLLEYFQIPAVRVPDVLYGILDAAGDVDTRFYIALPEWNEEGTSMALKLCRRILGCLPPFLVSSCGFLTYTKTFHNSQTNMIPSPIKLIFYPNNLENKRKYAAVSTKNYILDGKEGCFPVVNPDTYTKEMIKALSDCFLYGKKDTVWYPFFSVFGEMISWNVSFPPQALSCACKFTQIRDTLDQKQPLSFRMEELYYIIETYLSCKAFTTPQTEAYALVLLKKCTEGLPLDGDLLNILCDYYMLLSCSRETVISWLCQRLVEYCDQPELYMAVLNYSYEDPALARELGRRIYADLTFYPAARHLELVKLKEKQKLAVSWEESISNLYSSMERLEEEWPDFLLDAATVHMLKEELNQLCLNPDGRIGISYEALGYLYGKGNHFHKNHGDCEALSAMMLNLIRQAFSEDDLSQLKRKSVEQLREYFETLSQDVRLEDLKTEFEAAGHQIQVLEYMEALESGNGDTCVGLWEKNGLEPSIAILSRLELNIRQLFRRIRFEKEGSYDRFYGLLLLARVEEQKEVCRLVLEDRSELGGMVGMACLWEYAIKNGSLSAADKGKLKQLMHTVITTHFDTHGITSADIKSMKSVLAFTERVGVISYVNDASVMNKLKNWKEGLGTLGGKKRKEETQTTIPGHKSKDTAKKNQ